MEMNFVCHGCYVSVLRLLFMFPFLSFLCLFFRQKCQWILKAGSITGLRSFIFAFLCSGVIFNKKQMYEQ